jgi:hypothetical protein
MKSFSQFLYEAYLSEEEARQGSLFTRSGNPQNFKNPKKIPFTATDPTPIPQSKRLPGATPVDVSKAPQGQLNLPISGSKPTNTPGSAGTSSTPRPPGTTTTVSGSAITGKTPPSGAQQPGSTTTTPTQPRDTSYRGLGTGEKDIVKSSTPTSPQTPQKPNLQTGRGRRQGETPEAWRERILKDKPNRYAIVPTAKTPQINPVKGRRLRGALGALSAAGAAYSASQGDWGGAAEQGLLAAASSNRLNKGAAELGRRGVQSAATRMGMQGAGKIASRFVPGLQTAYGLYKGSSALSKGDYLGAGLGYASAIPGPVGGVAAVADIARDTFAPYNPKQDQTSGIRSSRQIASKAGKYGTQYGSALTGIGGKTITSKDASGNAFISSGVGKQRKTVQLSKTQLVRDPKTGKSVVGDLAFKGGKATYLARPSIASRDTNLWSRLQRWSGIGGQRERDVASAKKEYRTALANTQRYQKAIKGK